MLYRVNENITAAETATTINVSFNDILNLRFIIKVKNDITQSLKKCVIFQIKSINQSRKK